MILFIHLKCPLGHFSYPRVEQGRQLILLFSKTVYFVLYGYRPKSRTVLPHNPKISFLNAEATAINSLSKVNTPRDCFITLAI